MQPRRFRTIPVCRNLNIRVGAGTLSKPPIFRTKGVKSWPVLPLRRRDFWIILLTCILFCIFLFSRAKGGILTNYLFQFARILAFCFLGEICHAVLPLPIPASIYGLLLLLAALRFGIVKLEQVKEVGLFLLSFRPCLRRPLHARDPRCARRGMAGDVAVPH